MAKAVANAYTRQFSLPQILSRFSVNSFLFCLFFNWWKKLPKFVCLKLEIKTTQLFIARNLAAILNKNDDTLHECEKLLKAKEPKNKV